MKTVTLFSWGYWGWGTNTSQFVELVDTIEKARGFEPPIFVDTRIRRKGRAPGFSGDALAELLGSDRYRWMKWLGNRSIVEETENRRRIKIDHPEGAHSLLDLAMLAASEKRRVIFFCACQWPKCAGKVRCHRWEVGRLVLAAAKQRGIAAEVVEWPGGKARSLDLEVSEQLLRKVANGQRNIPLPREVDPAEMGGPAWCTIATLRSGNDFVRVLVGHVVAQDEQWSLQVVGRLEDSQASLTAFRQEADRLQDSEGWLVRR